MRNVIFLSFLISLWSGDCLAVDDLEDNCGPTHRYGLRHRHVKGDNSHALPPQDEPMTNTITTDQNLEKNDSYSFFSVINQAWQGLTNTGWDGLEQEEQQPLLTKKVTTTQERSAEDEEADKKAEEEALWEEAFSHLEEIRPYIKTKNFKSCGVPISNLMSKKAAEGFFLTGYIFENSPGTYSAREWYTKAMAAAKENSPLYRLAFRGLERCWAKDLKEVNDSRRSRCAPRGMRIKREK